MSETHVSSLVIHVRPERMEQVRAAILQAGAEIPVESPTGKFVAVLESAHESDITRFADGIAVHDGVIAANLVFHLIDDLGADDGPSPDTGEFS